MFIGWQRRRRRRERRLKQREDRLDYLLMYLIWRLSSFLCSCLSPCNFLCRKGFIFYSSFKLFKLFKVPSANQCTILLLNLHFIIGFQSYLEVSFNWIFLFFFLRLWQTIGLANFSSFLLHYGFLYNILALSNILSVLNVVSFVCLGTFILICYNILFRNMWAICTLANVFLWYF